jgi:hypothetical protein
MCTMLNRAMWVESHLSLDLSRFNAYAQCQGWEACLRLVMQSQFASHLQPPAFSGTLHLSHFPPVPADAPTVTEQGP